MTEGMSWRRLRSVLSKVVDGGVTGRGNCRSRALKEQLSAQPRQPWPEPRPWQGEPRMPIEEVGAIGFSAGVRGPAPWTQDTGYGCNRPPHMGWGGIMCPHLWRLPAHDVVNVLLLPELHVLQTHNWDFKKVGQGRGPPVIGTWQR